MEQRFGTNRIDLEVLRDFCEREGQCVVYRKGEQMEREGAPSRWFGFVAEGCFKYTVRSISERLRVGASAGIDREHITWFSFEGEFVTDYPNCLDGRPAQASIEAMMPSRVLRVTGEQMLQMFRQNMQTMELRSVVAEHLLNQKHARYLDLHRATPLERYELLLRRCPGIARHLPLNAIASFLCVTPQQLSRIRKAVTFSEK